MNKEEILAMEAGRALNMLIVEKVIGLIAWEEKRGEYTHIVFQKPDEREPYRRSRNWESEMSRFKLIEYSEINNHIHVVSEIKNYSTDISAAWEVVEKMQSKTNHFSLQQGIDLFWVATFYAGSHYAKESTAPESICKAALLAVMEDNQ